jgi:hypothetical protein
VASESQFAANRCNSRNSTGPRSAGGKKRASRNSYRHGLSSRLGLSSVARSVEKLARKIAGENADGLVLGYARIAAQAEFDLAHIRQIKVASVESILAFGGFASPVSRTTGVEPVGGEVSTSTELERTADAVRRALPELIKFDRYERSAAARRERSIYAISDIKSHKSDL